MPKISAFIHANNDGHRLGRTLETLRPCDEVIVIDHSSDNETAKVAREYGATVRKAIVGVEDGAYAMDTRHQWVVCIRSDETLSEALEAALFEWKDAKPAEVAGYNMGLREQHGNGWRQLPPETRLVDRTQLNWKAALPPTDPKAPRLEGDILRFPEN